MKVGPQSPICTMHVVLLQKKRQGNGSVTQCTSLEVLDMLYHIINQEAIHYCQQTTIHMMQGDQEVLKQRMSNIRGQVLQCTI